MKRYLEKIETMLPNPELMICEETYLQAEGLRVVLGRRQGEEILVVDGARAFRYDGEVFGGRSGIRICPLSQNNLDRLQLDFPHHQLLQNQEK